MLNRPCVAAHGAALAAFSMGATLLLPVNVSAQQVIEEVMVTAQRRESGAQTTPLAVSAFAGEQLAQGGVFSVEDLASSAPAFSMTQVSSLDLELNIRGISSTRLDSPTADPSVGLFIDDVYVGRTGALNTDFFDLERIELIRGPQGVLLGKNVVGGALSVITAAPEFETSGRLTLSAGNYDSQLVSGHVTGALGGSWAGRLSFQTRSRDGYARDVLNGRDLEDLDSRQVRAQALYQGETLTARFIADFSKDDNNGPNPVAVRATAAGAAWDAARAYFGITDIRRSAPSLTYFAGSTFGTAQFFERRSEGLTAKLDKELGGVTLSSITSYRGGRAENNYDQTGIGLGIVPTLADYQALVAADPRTAILSDSPVYEKEDVRQYSQELRLTSDLDGRFDWIAGVYYKHDRVDKQDRFRPESVAIPVLNGESFWHNRGEMTSYAAFAQVGFKVTDTVKLSLGGRYTRDDKSGDVAALAVSTGGRYRPADTLPATPLDTRFTAGTGYAAHYEDDWSRFTPQAILSWNVTDTIYTYVSASSGFKGGGFDDTPANAVAAQISFDPEEVMNYEAGIKSDLFDRRLRLNLSAFRMKYEDLQVQQTNQDCICLVTDNASSAKITGVEYELQYLPLQRLMLFASGSVLDAKYTSFIESSGANSSGKKLQRTPDTQYSVGFEITAPFAALGDALKLRTSYAYQSEMFWQPSNLNREKSFGVLDAQLSLAPEGARWRASLWGKNLTDEEYRVAVNPIFGEELSLFAPPRTYGIEFSWAFGQ